jgi:hypothetical protein
MEMVEARILARMYELKQLTLKKKVVALNPSSFANKDDKASLAAKDKKPLKNTSKRSRASVN